MDFPAIAGDYVHYRQEDVTEAGVTAANGLPLSLDFEGVLSRITVAGVQWMDCSTGILRVERDPWPSAIGMSIWVLTDGSRPSGTVLYNGLRTAPLNNNSHLNFHGDGMFRTTNNSTRTAIWPVPAADGPETMCWSAESDNTQINGYSLHHNGVDLGPSTMTDPARNATRDGTDFVIGAGSDLVPTGLRWRDVVLKIGSPLTAQEIDDLEAYAVARVTPPPPSITITLSASDPPDTASITASASWPQIAASMAAADAPDTAQITASASWPAILASMAASDPPDTASIIMQARLRSSRYAYPGDPQGGVLAPSIRSGTIQRP